MLQGDCRRRNTANILWRLDNVIIYKVFSLQITHIFISVYYNFIMFQGIQLEEARRLLSLLLV